jgi:hypothetical protein
VSLPGFGGEPEDWDFQLPVDVMPGRYYFEGAAVKAGKRSDFIGISPAFTVVD